MNVRNLAMVSIVAASSVLLTAPSADAQAPFRTKAGYVACLTLAEFNAQSRLLASGDQKAWLNYLENSSCIPL